MYLRMRWLTWENFRRRQPSLLTFWPFFFAAFFKSLLSFTFQMDEYLYIDSLQGTGCTVYAQILWPWQD